MDIVPSFDFSPRLTQRPDLFQVAWLEQLVQKLGRPSGPTIERNTDLCYYISRGSNGLPVRPIYVKLAVIDVWSESPCPSPSQTLAQITYYDRQSFQVPDSPCAVSQDSLRTFEQFLESDHVLRFQKNNAVGPFAGLQREMLKFADCYIRHTNDLILVRLSNFEFIS
jgi:hypothetical protein